MAALGVVSALALAGCTGGQTSGMQSGLTPDPTTSAPTASPTPSSTPPRADPDPDPVAPLPRLSPADVRTATAVAAVRRLAGRIGPRPGTSPAYFRAADYVEDQLEGHGWRVERQRFSTPAGVTDGVAVRAGASVNLVATRGDLGPGQPWLAVGAHLDTVPGAPGAEDNASGVGVLLALAEALSDHRGRLPVVLLVFGSEEPRGTGEDDHHYGSRAFVAELGPERRSALRGMVSLDRVGVSGPGGVVPVQTVAGPNRVGDELLAAARRFRVPVEAQPFEVSSDHESFHDEGLPAARLGSTPYAGYHSPGDVPAVVRPAQLDRTARILAAWLR